MATEESIKLWLKVGNLKKLEAAVLDGYGELLRGRTSRIPKINKFLKRVPHYQAKIASIHSAAASGDVRELENLLDRKGLVMARGPEGETLLHTAVIRQQLNAVKYLLDKYHTLLITRDHSGRSPLHYAALANDDGQLFDLLLARGADKDVKDVRGKTPMDYKENPSENRLRLEAAEVPKQRSLQRHSQQADTVASLLRQPSPIAPMTKSEVRSAIEKGDVGRLERIVLHGYGDRLIGEAASSGRVRSLIDSVPQHLSKLSAIKSAIEAGSLREVKNLLNRKCLVLARDSQGLTVLHHAVINGHKDIVNYLVSLAPKAIFAKDHEKRTPVHYAATLADDVIYKQLCEAGGNTTLPDCEGKTPEFYRQNPGALLDSRGSEGSAKKTSSIASNGSNSNKLSTTPAVSIKIDKPSSNGHRKQNGGGGSSSSSVVKQWLRSGDMDKLEKAVIDGHGLKLIRETTSDPRARAFLRTIPAHMSKISMLHEAVCQGSLRNLKVVLDRKKLIMSRDQLGLGLMHKAVIYGHEDIVRFLIDNYPQTINIKDKSGRTGLHYAAAMCPQSEAIYAMLLESGADPQQTDTKGNSAEYYRQHSDQLDVKEIVNRINRQRNRHMQSVAANKQMTSSSNKPSDNAAANLALVINGGNIRKWIHAEDLAKLEQVVLDGQGYKLLLETSNNPRVKQFLVGVPALVNKLREVHSAASVGDVAALDSALDKQSYLKSRDEAGMTPLHKAVLLENDDVVAYIVGINADTLSVKDEEGRTAVHYAAGLKDGGRMYNQLVEKCGGQSLPDNRGKTAEHYLRHPGELDMRQLITHARPSNKSVPGNNNNNNAPVGHRRPAAPNNLRPVRKASGGGNGVSNETIAKAIQLVELDKLEQLVLDGYGKRLIGKSSWSEEARAFLKKVPQYMDKIYALHTAAATGDLLTLQQLLDKKAMATSRDEYGLTALHKAVKYGQVDVVKYLLQTFPSCPTSTDQDGRTPLHYAAIYKGREDIYRLLLNNGADPKVQDQRGKSPEHYLLSAAKLEAPTIPKVLSDNKGTEKSGTEESGGEQSEDERQVKEWIINGDVEQLEQMVIEGRGDRLLGRSSDNEKTQEFLESVPVYMGKMRAVHNAAASGEVKDLHNILQDKPILAVCLDEQGACPLHRAVLHGHKDAMKFLANSYPQCLKVADKSGLTPLHYVAMVNDDGYFYRLLHNCGADPNVKDKSGLTPGHMLRGSRSITLEELAKRYEERRVPPRPHSVQTWERPPTEELLRALTPSPMAAAALMRDDDRLAIVEDSGDGDQMTTQSQVAVEEDKLDTEAVTMELRADDEDQLEQPSVEIIDEPAAKDEDDDRVDIVTNEDKNQDDDVIDIGSKSDLIEDNLENKQEIEVLDVDNDGQVNNVEIVEVEEEPSTVNVSEVVELSEKPIDPTVEEVEVDVKADDKPSEMVSESEDAKEKVELVDVTETQVDNEPETEANNEPEVDNEAGAEVEIEAETEVGREPDVDNEAVVEIEADVDAEAEAKAELDAEEEMYNEADLEESLDYLQYELGDQVKAEVEDDDSAEEIVQNSADNEMDSNDLIENEEAKMDEDRPAVIMEEVNEEEDTGDNVNQPEVIELVEEKGEQLPDDQSKLQEEKAADDVKLESQVSVESDGDVMTAALDKPELDSIPVESMGSLASPWSIEGDYLTAVLGDALIVAMAEVSRVRPPDPVAFMALLLYRYMQRPDDSKRSKLIEGELSIKELSELKGMDGSTLVHLAASRSHSVAGAMAELLLESGFDLAVRDGGCRTVRDVAAQVGQEESVAAVDGHVFELVRGGQLSAVEKLIYDGYDHLLDIVDDEGNDTIMVAELTHQLDMAQLLKSAQQKQSQVESLHQAVIGGEVAAARELIEADPRLVLAKNSLGQNAVHLATLSENQQMIQLLSTLSPQSVNMGDNVSEGQVGEDTGPLLHGHQ